MGELHLEIIVDRMKREFKVEANVGRPQVAYRETIRKRVEDVEGKFIRQSGGKGQYGHVVIDLEPGRAGRRASCSRTRSWAASIPREFIRPVEAGIKEALENGVLAGYPMVDVKVELVVRQLPRRGQLAKWRSRSPARWRSRRPRGRRTPILLEPIMDVEVVTPGRLPGRRDRRPLAAAAARSAA